jgi:hypothetical protein
MTARQRVAAERGHGLTVAEAAVGWISLFDGKTTFGWASAKVEDGRLDGGTTTTGFGDCELRGEVERGGAVETGGRPVTVEARRLVILSTGPSTRRRSGPVAGREAALPQVAFRRPQPRRVHPREPAERPAGAGLTWVLDGGRLDA